MADTGAISANSATNVEISKADWSSPGNVTASDDSRSTAALDGTFGGSSTDILTVKFDAAAIASAIPVGATIDGLLLGVEKSITTTSGSPVDAQVQFSKDGTWSGAVGTNLSSDKADTVTVWPTTDAYVSYGGAADVWGFSSLTRAHLVDSAFALLFRAQKAMTETSSTVRVDHVHLTIYYTPSGGSGPGVLRCKRFPGGVNRMGL